MKKEIIKELDKEFLLREVISRSGPIIIDKINEIVRIINKELGGHND